MTYQRSRNRQAPTWHPRRRDPTDGVDFASVAQDSSMTNLFDELNEKLKQDPRMMKRGGPRVDISLLLFNARDDVRALWHAAEAEIARANDEGREPSSELASAVERLRPIFGAPRARI